MDHLAELTDPYDLIAEASQALEYGLHNAAHKILAIIETEVWRRFTTPNGRLVVHESFAEFVTAKGLDGLNTDLRTVENVCRDNRKATAALTEVLRRDPGRPKKSLYNVQGFAPSGNSESAALRRLRKDRPDLHAQVLAGALTANAAMVKAGFRHPSATVPLDDMERLAAALRRRLDAGQVAALLEHLKSGGWRHDETFPLRAPRAAGPDQPASRGAVSPTPLDR